MFAAISLRIAVLVIFALMPGAFFTVAAAAFFAGAFFAAAFFAGAFLAAGFFAGAFFGAGFFCRCFLLRSHIVGPIS